MLSGSAHTIIINASESADAVSFRLRQSGASTMHMNIIAARIRLAGKPATAQYMPRNANTNAARTLGRLGGMQRSKTSVSADTCSPLSASVCDTPLARNAYR